MIYYIIGFFVISLCITAWSLWTAPLMPDDYDLKPEDIWPLDERSTELSNDDYKIFKEHLDNPKEPNAKIKEEAKLYKDANKEDKKRI